METPVQLEVHGVKASAYLDELIADNLEKIEKRFGAATSCRVVVRAPNTHHKSGEPFEVTLRLALPAHREINVSHQAPDGERSTDLTAAINDAFKRALRQLDDATQQLRGRVKHHEDYSASDGR